MSGSDRADPLQAAIRDAERTGDWTGVITRYVAAAEAGPEARCFFLTHAYVHALEANDPRWPALRARLVALNAERP